MSPQQFALVRYWFVLVVLLMVVVGISSHEHFRLMVLPLMLVAAVLDKTMRPPAPDDVPTLIETIGSSSWKLLMVLYAVGSVMLAVLSATIHDLGQWLGHNAWLVVSMLLLPIIGPILQHQLTVFRAYDEREP